MKRVIHERVIGIYRQADAAVAAAGPVCESSGRCCRFAEYGHTLFISQLEADVLLADAPPFAGSVSADSCPFQVNNLCTAREPRPLGCRVYFCDPNYQATGQAISETHLRKLKDLAEEFGLNWRYAPLHKFLNEARQDSDGPDQTETKPSPSRVALPVTKG